MSNEDSVSMTNLVIPLRTMSAPSTPPVKVQQRTSGGGPTIAAGKHPTPSGAPELAKQAAEYNAALGDRQSNNQHSRVSPPGGKAQARGSPPASSTPPAGQSPPTSEGRQSPPSMEERRQHMASTHPARRTQSSTSPPPERGKRSGTSTPAPQEGVETYLGIAPAPPPQSTDDDLFGDPRASPFPQPVGRVYTTVEFREIRKYVAEADASDEVQVFARLLWEKVPENEKYMIQQEKKHAASQSTGWSRDTMFSEASVRPERKLYNQVLGVLARVTHDNFDAMRRELIGLPIRQSSESEISSVVTTIYQKATRPEDAPFVDLYMKLVVELVNATGSSGTGKMIRKAIIECCQKQFEKPFELQHSDVVDENGNSLDKEEIEYKKMMLKDKLKANVKFLGQLFVNKLINEKVVNYVLYELMYGKPEQRHRKHKPEDYQIELFCELFRKVGPHLSAEMYKGAHFKNYCDSMLQLAISHEGPRIKFMLQDLLELQRNGWVERKGLPKSAMLDEKREASKSGPVHILARKEPEQEQVPLPSKDQIIFIMDDVVQNEAEFDSVVKFFKSLPNDVAIRGDYVFSWIYRALTVVRCQKEREMVGTFIDGLVKNQIITSAAVDDILSSLVKGVTETEMYSEVPKMFANWATIVYKDQTSFLGMDLHTMFLRHLLQSNASYTFVANFINAVSEVSGSRCISVSVKEKERFRRFRILPALMTYYPPAVYENGEMEEDDDPIDDDADMLDHLRELSEPEVGAFLLFCSRGTLKDLSQLVNQNPHKAELGLVMKIACALFTYVRFDTRELDKYKEWFVTVARGHGEKDFWLAILIEVHATWLELGCIPQDSLLQFIQSCGKINREAQAAFKTYLSRFYGKEGVEWCRRLDDLGK